MEFFFGDYFSKIYAFSIYFFIVISIGLHYLQKNHTVSDFFLGGRKINPYFTALSAEASDMSSWLLMALPGLAFVSGLKEAFWIAVGLILGTYINWLLVAKALRKCSAFYGNAITIPEFLARRFNDKSKLITIISAFFILVFFTIYTASGFVACAKLLAMVFDTSYIEALMIGIIIILTYSLLGGYWAICASDFVQSILIIAALIVTLALLLLGLGRVDEQSLSYLSDSFLNPFDKDAQFGMIQVVSAIGWGLGYFGMPHILVRFMSIKDEAQIPLARRIATFWIVIALAAAVLLGILARAYLGVDYNENNRELALINIFLMIYPAFIAGIFLCAVLAAAMSTADSQLLVATSAFSLDFVQNVLNKKMSNKKLLLLSRATIVIIAIIAFFIALDENSSIFSLVSYAWAGFGATFGPLILLALFWERCTAKGAVGGIITGGVVVIIWHNLSGSIFEIYEIIPGFISCLLATIFISYIDDDKSAIKKFRIYKKTSLNKFCFLIH